MSASNNESYNANNLTASSNLITGQSGYLGGIFCSSNTAATVTIYDGNDASTGTKIIDTFTPVAGQNYPFPCALKKGLFVAISGAASITVLWA